MHQQITLNQAPFFFFFKLPLWQALWPEASCPSQCFHSHPFGFFSSSFCRVRVFISCIMELNCSSWLVRGKSSLNPISCGRGRLSLSSCTCGTQPPISKYSENKECYPWNLCWLFVAAITECWNKGAANAGVKCDSTSDWLHISALSFFFFFP